MLTGLVAAFGLIVVIAAAVGFAIVLRAFTHGYGRVPDRVICGRHAQGSGRLGTPA